MRLLEEASRGLEPSSSFPRRTGRSRWHAVVVALLLARGAGGIAAASDWPMWGYDAERSGASPAALALPEQLHLQWVRVLPEPRRAWPAQLDDRDKLEFDLTYSPVVLDGRVFVASMTTDRLTAYAADTGAELWRFYADGPMRLAPAAWQGRVYAVSDDGRLYALDAETGERLWSHDPRPSEHRVLGNERVISMWPARGAPVVLDGTVYYAAGIWPFVGCGVYALNAETGALAWENTGFGSEWISQPHRTAYAFAGLAPQGYLAASGTRLVVAGGRTVPGLFDLQSGRLLHHQLQYIPIGGGYRVRVEGTVYYNHEERYTLENGEHVGSAFAYERFPALPSPERDALAERLDSVRDRVDGTIAEGLAAADRLFVVTREGRLYAFGEARPDEPRMHNLPAGNVEPADTEGGRQADRILQHTGISTGYALVLGAGHGDFLEQLAVRSRLRIVAIEPDPARVDAVRRKLDRAGLYGTRVAVLPGQLGPLNYPRYISSLIVALDPHGAGLLPQEDTLEQVESLLRPYDGQAWLGFDPDDSAVRTAIERFSPEAARLEETGDSVLIRREGPLPGAGQWTHQYADSAQSVMSGDYRVRLPLGPIWFGGPSNDHVLPRHAAGPRPHVAGGRLVILGVETISARCVYTGRELWVRHLPGIGHPFTNLELEARWQEGNPVYMTNQPGATYIGSPYVSLPDAVYVRQHNRILQIDPATGRTVKEWTLPKRDSRMAREAEAPDWGHISVAGDRIITTTNPHIFRGGDLGSRGDDSWDGTSSERLLGMDRHTGEIAWIRDADIGFRHNAIASGNGRLFVNDLLTEQAIQIARRRGMDLEARPRLIALDVETGSTLWSLESEVFGTFLSYSEPHDILVEGASHDGRFRLSGEPGGRLIARRGKTGEPLWTRRGAYSGPVILREDMIIPGRPGAAICLHTGRDLQRIHPMTGEETPLDYMKSYGCGSANASPHLLLFRSGAAGFTDLEHDGGTGNIGGVKSGCTSSMIAADGVLNMPDYTRTCTCSYQHQTSLGLVHMPEMELWTVQRMLGRVEGQIQRIGLNLGAPGDRRTEDGTVWMHVPQQAPSPDLAVLLQSSECTDAPAYVLSVEAGARADGFERNTLDDDPRSFWQIACHRTGVFHNGFLDYAFDRPVQLDHVQMSWGGPAGTQFRIETRNELEELVLEFPLPLDGWKFQTDPEDLGNEADWHHPGYDDGSWSPFQIGIPWTKVDGYRDYLGAAWYRRTVVFPALPEGQDQDPGQLNRVELAFGGVDESAWVWINGRLVGEHAIGPAGWDQPFALRIADEVRWGQENQITIRVLNTIGDGGIWRPIHLRAQRGGWRTVHEGEGRGRGWRRFETLRFDPVTAREVRVGFLRHGDEDPPGGARPLGRVSVYRVRFGDLPFPEAYAYFNPPAERFFRHHALRVESANGINWVASSGMRDLRRLTFRDVQGNGDLYTVTLHFSEPDGHAPGERRFDVWIEERQVAEAFDSAAAAQGRNEAVSLTVRDIPIDRNLTIKLAPSQGSSAPPVLCGVELIRQ